MRFRIDNLRFGGTGQRQHTHSGCACHQRIRIELPVKRIGSFECLAGLGSAGHKSRPKAYDYPVRASQYAKKKFQLTENLPDRHKAVVGRL
jgi:hypothetical protein